MKNTRRIKAHVPVAPERRPEPVFEPQTRSSKPVVNPVAIGAIVLVAAAAGILGFVKVSRDRMTVLRTKTIPETVQKLVGDSTVKVKEIKSLKEVSGVYEFQLDLDYNGTVRNYTSYVTKDGKVFFTTGVKVTELAAQAKNAGAPQAAEKTSKDKIEKTATPKLTAYVVSQCPYGLQMQRAMSKAIGEASDLAKYIEVKYIGSVADGKITSMHGDAEAQENLRQICIREEQNTAYWPYVSCYMKEGKTEDCLAKTGVDTAKLTACTTDAKRGLAFAGKDFASASALKVTGSPTMIANGKQTVSEFDFGGRTADAIRQLTCAMSKDKLSFCDKALTTEAVAASFESQSAGTGGGAAANCGN